MREHYMFNLFITHAWRYHDSWNSIVDCLDNAGDFQWSNFSVPWYDPAFQPKSEDGYARISEWIISQIIPVDVVIFLSDLYSVKSNRQWLSLELKEAVARKKPIIKIGEEECLDLDVSDLKFPLEFDHINLSNISSLTEGISKLCRGK